MKIARKLIYNSILAVLVADAAFVLEALIATVVVLVG